MNRRALLALAFICAVFGTLDSARAGTFTYDFVTPSNFTNGTHFTGSITLDCSAISTTPIDLTVSMIQSWQLSVFDSQNNLLFSSSSGDGCGFSLSGLIGPTFKRLAPEVTTTALFLPALSLTGLVTRSDSFFDLDGPGSAQVQWFSSLGTVSGSTVEVHDSTGATVDVSTGTLGMPVIIATNPEPASLSIWSLAHAVIGVGDRRKRRPSSLA